MTSFNIKIRLFGEFREYFDYIDIILDSLDYNNLQEKFTIEFYKKIADLDIDINKAKLDNLLESSAFAMNGEILTKEDKLDNNAEYAILPPVSGG